LQPPKSSFSQPLQTTNTLGKLAALHLHLIFCSDYGKAKRVKWVKFKDAKCASQLNPGSCSLKTLRNRNYGFERKKEKKFGERDRQKKEKKRGRKKKDRNRERERGREKEREGEKGRDRGRGEKKFL
jgi:hypothetical protein